MKARRARLAGRIADFESMLKRAKSEKDVSGLHRPGSLKKR